MLTLLEPHFAAKNLSQPTLNFLLARMIADMQGDFCRFADCGAGVGNVALSLRHLLRENLPEAVLPKASIVCYEPLPENFAEMTRRLGEDSMFKLRNVAVAASAGTANFNVPSRMRAGAAAIGWTEGTSYAGFLSSAAAADHLVVETVRLADEGPFDFVKLDLQGGELEAIKGLGASLNETKLLYVETHLMWSDMSTDYLNRKGFITFMGDVIFGMAPTAKEVPFDAFDAIGINVTRVQLPSGAGLPLLMWGRFRPNAEPFSPETLTLKQPVIDAIKAAGVPWMATDVLAINKSVFPSVFRYLM